MRISVSGGAVYVDHIFIYQTILTRTWLIGI